MISYLSRPIAPGTIPSQEPIELIAQVAQQKQHRYDTVQQAVLAQYQNLLNLDTSYASSEITNRYNQKMGQATKDLESLAKLDLMNPDNISKVESVFSPILNDTNIMTAVADTRRLQKERTVMEQWRTKHPDKYNAENYNALLEDIEYNRNLSEKDWETKRLSPVAVEYNDYWSSLTEQALALPEVSQVVTMPDGNKWIITTDGTRKTFNSILSSLNVDSKMQAQMEIDSRKAYSQYSPQDIVLLERKEIEKEQQVLTGMIASVNKELSIVDDRLIQYQKESSTRVLTPEEYNTLKELYPQINKPDVTVGEVVDFLKQEKAGLTNQIKDNNTQLQTSVDYLAEFDKQFQITLTGDKPNVEYKFDVREERHVKSRYFIQNKKQQAAKAFEVRNTKTTVTHNPFALSEQNYYEALALKTHEANLAVEKARALAEAGLQSDGKTPGTGGAPAVLLEGIAEASGDIRITTDYMDNQIKTAQAKVEENKKALAETLLQNDTDITQSLTEQNQEEYLQKANEIFNDLSIGLAQIQKAQQEGTTLQTITIDASTTLTLEEFQKRYGEYIPMYDENMNAKEFFRVASEFQSGINREATVEAKESTLGEIISRGIKVWTKTDKGGLTYQYLQLDSRDKELLLQEGFLSEKFLKAYYEKNKNRLHYVERNHTGLLDIFTLEGSRRAMPGVNEQLSFDDFKKAMQDKFYPKFKLPGGKAGEKSMLTQDEYALLGRQQIVTDDLLKKIWNRNKDKFSQVKLYGINPSTGKYGSYAMDFQGFKSYFRTHNDIGSNPVKDRADKRLSELEVNKFQPAYTVPSDSDLFDRLRDIAINNPDVNNNKPLSSTSSVQGISFLPSESGDKFKVTYKTGTGADEKPAEAIYTLTPEAKQTLKDTKMIKVLDQFHSSSQIVEFLALEGEARATNPNYLNYATNKDKPSATITVNGKQYKIIANNGNSFSFQDLSVKGAAGIERNVSRAELIPYLLKRSYMGTNDSGAVDVFIRNNLALINALEAKIKAD